MAGDRFQVVDGRKFPFFRIHNEIIDDYGARMGAHGLAIYCALSRHADQKDECWPSHALLAEETGMSVSSVKKAIKRLIELGLIKKDVRRWAKVGPRSTLYTLLELPGGHSRHAPMLQAGDAYAHSRQVATNNTNMSKTHGKPSTKASRVAKRKALRGFGVRGSIVTEIARDHDMPWIRKAMEEMANPTPASIVYLHRQGWEPEPEEEEMEDDFCLVCSVCGLLDGACKCPDPKPEQMPGPEFQRLLESGLEREHVGGSDGKETA